LDRLDNDNQSELKLTAANSSLQSQIELSSQQRSQCILFSSNLNLESSIKTQNFSAVTDLDKNSSNLFEKKSAVS
jgi:hypothetical protein